jgi:hypothetical protein
MGAETFPLPPQMAASTVMRNSTNSMPLRGRNPARGRDARQTSFGRVARRDLSALRLAIRVPEPDVLEGYNLKARRVMVISQDANARPLTEPEQAALETVEKKHRPSDDYVVAPRISKTNWQSIQIVTIQNRTTGAARTYNRGFDAAHPGYWITRFSEALEAREF